MDMFARNLGGQGYPVDAVDDFMGKLAGVSDPEQKRKIIGKEFIPRFSRLNPEVECRQVAGPGTIYPDVDRIRRQRARRAPTPSRATTTSVACRKTCTLASLSRCVSCSG